jgi:hypothetical protein
MGLDYPSFTYFAQNKLEALYYCYSHYSRNRKIDELQIEGLMVEAYDL